MAIGIEALLKEHRIEIADGTWLCWDEYANEWVLREQPYRRRSRVKAIYPNLEAALKAVAQEKGA